MTAEHVYPAAPKAPTSARAPLASGVRMQAAAALALLLAFILAYLALAGWLTWSAGHLLASAWRGVSPLWAGLAGGCAALLAAGMWSKVLFPERRDDAERMDVAPADQPRLFELLDSLADELGAPRVQCVSLLPGVRAVVRRDVGLLNLLLPARARIELGLGLVNVFSVTELKAVLAHEFAHSARSAGALGRGVFLAQRIASGLVTRRDALDRRLRRWLRSGSGMVLIGWVVSTVVWSLRAVVESIYRLIVWTQQGVTRALELQADRKAVAVAGSDAFVYALRRLHAAEDTWRRTLEFATAEALAKRSVADVFAVQQHISATLRDAFDDPAYGDAPELRVGVHGDRIVDGASASPPDMWSAHPSNVEREENAKRERVSAAVDDRSAWELFDDAPELRRQASTEVLRAFDDADIVPLKDSLTHLQRRYAAAAFARAHRGVYVDRRLTLGAQLVDELFDPLPAIADIKSELAALYPPSLLDHVNERRALARRVEVLRALSEEARTAPGGVVHHAGKALTDNDLEKALAAAAAELARIQQALEQHDRRCRAAHLAAATQLGAGWAAYLKGLASVLHYAEHAEADVRRAYDVLRELQSFAAADGRVPRRQRPKLIAGCMRMYEALQRLHEQSAAVVLDRTLLRRLHVQRWSEALGELTLPAPDSSNLHDWLKAIGGWQAGAVAALSDLRCATLDQLLLAEAQIARFARGEMKPGPVPEASRIAVAADRDSPAAKPRGDAQSKRMQPGPRAAMSVARFAVAAAVVGGVWNVSAHVGAAPIIIYNGLAQSVVVAVGGAAATVAPFEHAQVVVQTRSHRTVRTTTAAGHAIEQFDLEPDAAARSNVYNVGGAGVLLESDVNRVGASQALTARWIRSEAVYAADRSSGADGQVLTPMGDVSPATLLAVIPDDVQRAQVIKARAQWDSSTAVHTAAWLALAAREPGFQDVLRERLARDPRDVLTLRAEQDATPRDLRVLVCNRHRALAQAAPEDPDLEYVAARCMSDLAERDRVIARLYERAPKNGWVAMAMAHAHVRYGRWSDALAPLELALEELPALREELAVELMRVRRLVSIDDDAPSTDLTPLSDALQGFVKLYASTNLQPGAELGYFHLGRGEIERAVSESEQDAEAGYRILRLAAASDGAPRRVVQGALLLPLAQGMDRDSIWAALALALRERKDPAPYLLVLREYRIDGAQQVLDFITKLRSSTDYAAAERTLDGLDPVLRAHAYSVALVVLGSRAPEEWRRSATRLLFIPERPYFLPEAQTTLTQAAQVTR